MPEKILLVDDEINVLNGYRRILRKEFSLDIAQGGQSALDLVEARGDYAVIVADMQMPEMNGVELLVEFQKKSPNSVRIMLTGNADQQTAIQAVNEGGVFQFLNKPCPPEELAKTLHAAVNHHRLIVAEKELLEKTLQGSVSVLIEILSQSYPKLFSQAKQLKNTLKEFLQSHPVDRIWEIELAAMLSPIGLVTVPPETVEKSQNQIELDPVEKELLASIPELGADLLRKIPRLGGVAQIVHYQNKRFDGGGFPQDKLKGNAIPKGARLLKIFSDLLKLKSRKLTTRQALERMAKADQIYDPAIVTELIRFYEKPTSEPTESTPNTISIAIKDLLIGHVLAKDIVNINENLLVTANTEITQLISIKLMNFHRLGLLKEPVCIYKPEIKPD